MQHSDLALDHGSRIDGIDHASCIGGTDVIDVSASARKLDDVDTMMPLTEAKRLAAAEFERRYLIRVMERARGSVSGGARLSGLDRTNFRRLLQRHGLHGVALGKAAP